MNHYPDPIAVVIATSKDRTQLLYSRSLRSVYLQEDVNILEIVIVDDNLVREGMTYSNEYPKIKDVINTLRKELLAHRLKNMMDCLPDDYFKTTLLKNNRIQGHSGTGAWNTAIFYLAEKYREDRVFVAILDDDDEYLSDYLKTCVSIIRKKGEKVAAIFPYIRWLGEGKNKIFEITHEDLKPNAFFVGNPGVQSSNMCIRLDLLVEIGGFDENLYSATDRDLMIRLLNYLALLKDGLEIIILPKVMAIHYVDLLDRVTTDKLSKKRGLDTFYKKWKDKFPEENFKESLSRARRLFGYVWENE